MSAEVLREAARLMRERAEDATPGEWVQNGFEYDDIDDSFTYDIGMSGTASTLGYAYTKGDAEHIASWHPTVALVVADWLEHAANAYHSEFASLSFAGELQVARAYLGTATSPGG